FPIAFEPLGALENAAYANAALARLRHIDSLNQSLEGVLESGDRAEPRAEGLKRAPPTQPLIYTCNHAEHVMTAWALGPQDKANILVQFWAEWMYNEDTLHGAFDSFLRLREQERQPDQKVGGRDLQAVKQELQQVPAAVCRDAYQRQWIYQAIRP